MYTTPPLFKAMIVSAALFAVFFNSGCSQPPSKTEPASKLPGRKKVPGGEVDCFNFENEGVQITKKGNYFCSGSKSGGWFFCRSDLCKVYRQKEKNHDEWENDIIKLLRDRALFLKGGLVYSFEAASADVAARRTITSSE